jgi:hypothetical protein
MARAESILEFLTAKNPEVEYPTPRNKSLTSRRNFYGPKQLKHWDEFNFETLEAIYEGSLISEACQKGSALPDFPYIVSEFDCIVDDESTTIHVLTKWNHTIVTAALVAVRQTFHPCIWMPKPRRSKESEPGTPTEQDTTKREKKRSPRFSTSWKADAGAVSSCQASASSQLSHRERLPKDYKTASKWNSLPISSGQLIDETGKWRLGKDRKNVAMPIRQVYTYCVDHGCRYGCILTTGEAFIFRIRPRGSMPGENLYHAGYAGSNS